MSTELVKPAEGIRGAEHRVYVLQCISIALLVTLAALAAPYHRIVIILASITPFLASLAWLTWIKPLTLIPVRLRTARVACILAGVLAAATANAADLSRYHQFHIGSDLATVLQSTHQDSAKVKVLHQHPALIQELEWNPDRSGSPAEFEAVRVIVFSFYEGQLFRMFVDYDRSKTEGLSADDLISSISTVYGTATKPAAMITIGSQAEYAYSSSERVLARWQDTDYSLSLVGSSHQPSFGLIMTSRPKDLVAQKAIVEGERLDVVAAPQIARDRAKKEAADELAKQENAKELNKPAFKP